jgi:DNA-binding response OmpR family regulator
MMQSWQTREKVTEIRLLLEHLATHRTDVATLTKVNKFFHQLAGAGGIYEMSDFCNVAIAGEELCSKMLACKAPMGHIEQLKLEGLCEMLGKAVEAEAEAMKKAEPVGGDTARGAPTRKFDVLLVDSHSDRISTWHRFFENKEMGVRTVKTASGARGAMLIQVPDLLIIHGPLPDSPYAFEAIQHLRGTAGGDKTVVFIVAEKAAFKAKVDAIKSGADSFVEGEIAPEELLDKANDMLERRHNKQFKILSVEDDPEQAYFIKTTLESVGYTVLHLDGPEHFEEALNSFAPHLVLLDIMLGDISGHDLARFVRHHETFNALPIVFLTTENQMSMHLESARAGGDEHLVKPIAPQLLVATIAGRLERL